LIEELRLVFFKTEFKFLNQGLATRLGLFLRLSSSGLFIVGAPGFIDLEIELVPSTLERKAMDLREASREVALLALLYLRAGFRFTGEELVVGRVSHRVSEPRRATLHRLLRRDDLADKNGEL